MSALQWYSYKLERVVFNYKRYDWHLLFFVVPIFVYYLSGKFFPIYLFLLYLPTLVFWYKKLDKKLVFTNRVKRFFLFLTLAVIFQDFLCFSLDRCQKLGVILPLFVAVFTSFMFEKILFLGYKKEAKKKLENQEELKIIAITASYGKTSIKNFLYQILSIKYNCYKTPKSVNTIGGIIKDINENLPSNLDFYIVEAGARLKGDIAEISRLINHQYAIVGVIGEQHLEYFKTLENIRNTKMELIESNRLKIAYVHKSANVKPNDKVRIFGDELKEVNSTLDGLIFKVKINDNEELFEAPLLGSFNAINILAAINIAKEFMSIEDIKKAVKSLKSVEHRLQKIEAGGKIIIDDSYNGNLEGMTSSYDLVSSYEGRKVIVTPGIVESTDEANEKLAKKIDEVFDLVILTGKINIDILDKNIKKSEKIIVKDKSKIEEVLQENTFGGDLIIFSNDTPSFM
ncbi:Mur ligase family protein [Sulfurospirillum sp. 1307]|jgi:UDP-N-acetylmuramoyl-tripeptide--D-alanyl-D-alanine ligase